MQHSHEVEPLQEMRARHRSRHVVLWLATLAVCTLITFVVITATSVHEETTLLNDCLDSLPGIIDDQRSSVLKKVDTYHTDYETRGKLGLILFEHLPGLDTQARLERVKTAVSALDATLVGTIEEGGVGSVPIEGEVVEEGDVTAEGDVTSKENEETEGDASDEGAREDGEGDQTSEFNGYGIMATTRTEDSHGLTTSQLLEATTIDGSLVDLNELEDLVSDTAPETDDEDSERINMVWHAKTADGDTLVFEFDYTPIATVFEEQGTLTGTLERMLAGIDARAFARLNPTGTLAAYPNNGNASETGLDDMVGGALDGVHFVHLGPSTKDGSTYGLVMLDGVPHFAARRHLDADDLDALVAVPLGSFTLGALHCLIATTCLQGLMLALLFGYIVRTLTREGMADADEPNERAACVRCRPALVVTLLIVSVTSFMLLTIEGVATTAMVTEGHATSLAYDIGYHQDLTERMRTEFMDRCVKQATAIAHLVSERPSLRKQSGLRRLADIVGADYAMLFDAEGAEVCASNTYTGYTVEGDEDEAALRKVMKGSAYAVGEPHEREEDGSTYHVVAALVTNEEGNADGFVTVAFTDDEIERELEAEGPESTVASFATAEDQVALVVDNESGLVVAHTDPDVVGEAAAGLVDPIVLEHDFQGFAFFDNVYTYVSSRVGDQLTCVLVSLDATNGGSLGPIIIQLILVALIIAIPFYHISVHLVLTGEEVPALIAGSLPGYSPIRTILIGYVCYLSVLAIAAAWSCSRGKWSAFGFVFDGKWGHGIHPFSVWAALFMVACTFTISTLLRFVLDRLNRHGSVRAKTLARLTDSLIFYVSIIFCTIAVLTLFGVDTTTLLASAGIASIAIGMGAKDLIADILAGLLIVSEGTIHVGDEIEIAGWRGRVMDMGIRTCRIQNENNDVKVITNSHISDVININNDVRDYTLDIEVPRLIEAAEIERLAAELVGNVTGRVDDLRGRLHVDGITDSDDENYTVRVSLSCAPSKRERMALLLKNTLRGGVRKAHKARRRKHKGIKRTDDISTIDTISDIDEIVQDVIEETIPESAEMDLIEMGDDLPTHGTDA